MKKKNLILLFFLLLMVVLSSCNIPGIIKPTETPDEKTPTIVEKENIVTIIHTALDKEIKIKLPENSFKLSDLPDFSDDDYYFLGYSINNDNNYLSENTVYSVTDNLRIYAKFGIKKDTFLIDSVDSIYITTEEAITSKEDYVTANIEIIGENYSLASTPTQIRLRGNSSLGVPKKSYKIKLYEKENIFNFGKDKEWALIANYFDPAHLRNYYAYKLAKALDMEYYIDCKFVNVYLNNVNQGLYLFTETVKTSSNRVDIEDGYSPTEIDIPFLIELDFKLEENNPNYIKEQLDIDFFFLDNTKYNGKRYQFATKYPKTFTTEHITLEQYDFIKNYMHEVYKSVRNKTYEYYIDVDSFIDYFIIQELFLNIDQDYSSVFMYKPYGDLLHMGPAWDFDLSCGNCSYVGTYDPYRKMKDINGGNYLFVTLMEDEPFRQKFLARLQELDDTYIISSMISSFYYNEEILTPYATTDNEIWNNLYEWNWARPEWLLNKTYPQQVSYLRNFLEQHYYWMLSNM